MDQAISFGTIREATGAAAFGITAGVRALHERAVGLVDGLCGLWFAQCLVVLRLAGLTLLGTGREQCP